MKIIFISILLIFALVIFGLFKACKSCSSEQKEITVNVNIGSDALNISNTSSNTYSGIRVKLNGDYFYETYSLGAFESKTIDYSSFSKSDGTRFLSLFQTVNNIYISGTYNGDKYWAYFEPKK